MSNTNKKGFTLINVIGVVVILLGILLIIPIPIYQALEKALT